MDNDLTPVQKIDTLLCYFREKNPTVEKQIHTIERDLNSVINPQDILFALRKLVKDGYVDKAIKTYNESPNPVFGEILKDYDFYSVSFEGYLFIGYGKKSIIDDRNERRIRLNEKLLTQGTWFAGIAAFLLLLWQIFVWLYPVHADYPYWIWETIPKKH